MSSKKIRKDIKTQLETNIRGVLGTFGLASDKLQKAISRATSRLADKVTRTLKSQEEKKAKQINKAEKKAKRKVKIEGKKAANKTIKISTPESKTSTV